MTDADGATTERPPAQKRRRTPGGLPFSEEKGRPDARDTPKAGKGQSPPVIARTRPREERTGSRSHRGGREALEGRKPRGGSGAAIGNTDGFAIGGIRWLAQRTSGGMKTG